MTKGFSWAWGGDGRGMKWKLSRVLKRKPARGTSSSSCSSSQQGKQGSRWQAEAAAAAICVGGGCEKRRREDREVCTLSTWQLAAGNHLTMLKCSAGMFKIKATRVLQQKLHWQWATTRARPHKLPASCCCSYCCCCCLQVPAAAPTAWLLCWQGSTMESAWSIR